jgi:hypothetical protein
MGPEAAEKRLDDQLDEYFADGNGDDGAEDQPDESGEGEEQPDESGEGEEADSGDADMGEEE